MGKWSDELRNWVQKRSGLPKISHSERKECLKVEFLLSNKGFCIRTRINKWSMLAQSCFFVGTDGRLLDPDKHVAM